MSSEFRVWSQKKKSPNYELKTPNLDWKPDVKSCL
jgi:hypothetical protein